MLSTVLSATTNTLSQQETAHTSNNNTPSPLSSKHNHQPSSELSIQSLHRMPAYLLSSIQSISSLLFSLSSALSMATSKTLGSSISSTNTYNNHPMQRSTSNVSSNSSFFGSSTSIAVDIPAGRQHPVQNWESSDFVLSLKETLKSKQYPGHYIEPTRSMSISSHTSSYLTVTASNSPLSTVETYTSSTRLQQQSPRITSVNHTTTASYSCRQPRSNSVVSKTSTISWLVHTDYDTLESDSDHDTQDNKENLVIHGTKFTSEIEFAQAPYPNYSVHHDIPNEQTSDDEDSFKITALKRIYSAPVLHPSKCI